MKNLDLSYGIGALLYCPANNDGIVNSIINQSFGNKYSLALCLEDTINDGYVAEAENALISNISRLYNAQTKSAFYLPKIFIRVRNAEQIIRLSRLFDKNLEIITGFILPKFSTENVDLYIHNIIKVNETATKPVYLMPIFENFSILDLRKRYDILYSLKDKLDQVDDLVLNIRVGGNDLCHAFGFRRKDTESIHQIKPVSNIFSDIITVYGLDYVVSGPVWEYYNGENWKQGLINELTDDRLCGFIGKTVIHPKQIESVNNAYKVSNADLQDAKSVLNWDFNSSSLVSANPDRIRMNEYNTHYNWANKIILQAKHFGVIE